MKQHITIEQLPNDIENIMKLAHILDIDSHNCDKPFYVMSKALNIGKMIEILNDCVRNKLSYFDIKLNQPNLDFDLEHLVQIGHYDEDGMPVNKEYINKELCDALWSACVYVLTN